ncbi:SNF2 family helicase ATPase [Pyrenophora seminiperda CCB06]|uniref:SNF2 family helicase ATPase n=1 Tax=Pyrenophora seminiperda CCB06 TaxID=1302712 RepID=A0A3M7M944_9PLEO|nr:SNF2 family helicase ATPase [Pyrenophora seminiperda CCB06]
MPASDPWFWTVDQVVAEVCGSDALYLAARVPTSNVPDGAALEKQLRMEQITGKRFLLLFDRPKIVVKNALSIAQLSQRMALADVIDLLRSRSYTYGQQEATAGVKSLDINRKHSLDLSVSGFPSNVTSRKRRKITPVSTAPLSKRPQATQTATPSTGPAPEDPSVNTNSWSHLLRWENDRDTDDIIDFAAEEELEEPEEEDEESHDSLDEEDEVPEQSSSRLTQEEVVNIINDRIEHYTTSWAPNKGVARGEEIDYDPVLMWEEVESSGQREAMVQRYEMEHAYYKQRLDTLCDEIVKSPGSNAVSDRVMIT